MFLGEFVHTIDEKGRLTVPAKFRDGLATGLVVTRGIDRCLAIYSVDEWEQMAEKVSALPMTDRSARAFRRLVFAGASDAVPDKQGRVLIPPNLREYAGLDGEVIVTGLYTYIEVWNPDAWGEEREHVEGNDGNIEEWAALGI
ncbi:MAG: cell division/cell wall cluster transcriptional repressor MraZ [Chloroflexi bacterium]|nr:MAG: cell division/cell wall cluster transcriptional repressor MraZ [Anaerolineaceae bacterium 4572_32.2]RLC78690.1 MAG: cell division/cell wall cluster transcriptional repressor MraZ [Chloroflexota bacterium]RLC86462.1 MAG: cell division/cell wall cluster transcriptional repressor MraZ [Chloroflexota bacterium]HEY71841.1 division/cell wall cluster transcriptional repressor MraZ [Thermoflexia bacterium]